MSALQQSIQCRRGSLPELVRDFGWRTRSNLGSAWTNLPPWRIHERRSKVVRPGPPIVFLHGLVISSLYFIPLAECLSTDWTVRVPDQPGFGRSSGPKKAPTVEEMAALMIQWLSGAKIGKCYLVANSLGCQIAAAMAQQAPGRFEGIVLIGPTVYDRGRGFWNQAARIVWDAPHEPLQLWMNHVLDQFRAGCPRIWQMIFHMLADQIESRLPHIQSPTLVIRGDKDPSAPRDWGERVTKLLPQGELKNIPGWHCVHYTHPRETAEVIGTFLRRVAGTKIGA